ncbi:hypothetical protein DRP53_04350 [candidate division WOR-3 bacterium]|uniref:PDZ domain-containing protein n=1 Tax=candidate division WOR-3 bacterium TaxID=2052148 RepID=A0A660SJC4_UNCW3|nr:MAG: hypothetical protein DRP53_04350 [candidate division WOR-3 bacterium]
MKRLPLTVVGIIAASAALFSFFLGFILAQGRIQAEETEAVKGLASSPFVSVVKEVLPAVVNISAEKVVAIRSPGFEFRFQGPFDEFFRQFFRNFPPIPEKSKTLGSGFIIDPKGYIVTNNHVIKGAENIIIKLQSGEEFKGDEVEIVGTDPRTDIALIKVKTKKELPYLRLGSSDEIEVGDWAIAIGNPFHFEGTVTVGVISAKGRSGLALPEGPIYQNFLQTDAAINPGNSGGPLVNIKGEVIGINTAITSPSGGNVGIGFAIPIDLAKKVIKELREKGKVERGYLGVYPQEITEEMKEGLDLPSTEGVLIRDVLPNTPADQAGLMAGDVIIEFDGKKVKNVDQFRIMVAETPIGKKVKIIVLRDGKRKILHAKIGSFPEEISQKEKGEQGIGIMVKEVSEPKPGVVIERIVPASPADRAGLKEGDLIVKINRRRIRSLKEYMEVLTELKDKKVLVFQILRQDQTYFITLRR